MIEANLCVFHPPGYGAKCNTLGSKRSADQAPNINTAYHRYDYVMSLYINQNHSMLCFDIIF